LVFFLKLFFTASILMGIPQHCDKIVFLKSIDFTALDR